MEFFELYDEGRLLTSSGEAIFGVYENLLLDLDDPKSFIHHLPDYDLINERGRDELIAHRDLIQSNIPEFLILFELNRVDFRRVASLYHYLNIYLIALRIDGNRGTPDIIYETFKLYRFLVRDLIPSRHLSFNTLEPSALIQFMINDYSTWILEKSVFVDVHKKEMKNIFYTLQHNIHRYLTDETLNRNTNEFYMMILQATFTEWFLEYYVNQIKFIRLTFELFNIRVVDMKKCLKKCFKSKAYVRMELYLDLHIREKFSKSLHSILINVWADETGGGNFKNEYLVERIYQSDPMGINERFYTNLYNNFSTLPYTLFESFVKLGYVKFVKRFLSVIPSEEKRNHLLNMEKDDNTELIRPPRNKQSITPLNICLEQLYLALFISDDPIKSKNFYPEPYIDIFHIMIAHGAKAVILESLFKKIIRGTFKPKVVVRFMTSYIIPYPFAKKEIIQIIFTLYESYSERIVQSKEFIDVVNKIIQAFPIEEQHRLKAYVQKHTPEKEAELTALHYLPPFELDPDETIDPEYLLIYFKGLQDKGHVIKYLFLLPREEMIEFLNQLNYLELKEIKSNLEYNPIRAVLREDAILNAIDQQANIPDSSSTMDVYYQNMQLIMSTIDYWFPPTKAKVLKTKKLSEIRMAFEDLFKVPMNQEEKQKYLQKILIKGKNIFSYLSKQKRIDSFIQKNIDYWFFKEEADELKKQTLSNIRDAFKTLFYDNAHTIRVADMLRHIKVITSDKNFKYRNEIARAKRDEGDVKFKKVKCPYCKKNIDSDALDVHIALEHKDKVKIRKEKCPFCLRPFKPSELEKHIEDEHPNDTLFSPDFDAFINA